jgi:hypothetical protein
MSYGTQVSVTNSRVSFIKRLDKVCWVAAPLSFNSNLWPPKLPHRAGHFISNHSFPTLHRLYSHSICCVLGEASAKHHRPSIWFCRTHIPFHCWYVGAISRLRFGSLEQCTNRRKCTDNYAWTFSYPAPTNRTTKRTSLNPIAARLDTRRTKKLHRKIQCGPLRRLK